MIAPRKNKWRFFITLALVFLMCPLFLVYAYVQHAEAETQRNVAAAYREYAEKNMKRADEQQLRAEKLRQQMKDCRIKIDELTNLVAEKDSIIRELKRRN
jgi:hypothetical protein